MLWNCWTKCIHTLNHTFTHRHSGHNLPSMCDLLCVFSGDCRWTVYSIQMHEEASEETSACPVFLPSMWFSPSCFTYCIWMYCHLICKDQWPLDFPSQAKRAHFFHYWFLRPSPITRYWSIQLTHRIRAFLHSTFSFELLRWTHFQLSRHCIKSLSFTQI